MRANIKVGKNGHCYYVMKIGIFVNRNDLRNTNSVINFMVGRNIDYSSWLWNINTLETHAVAFRLIYFA